MLHDLFLNKDLMCLVEGSITLQLILVKFGEKYIMGFGLEHSRKGEEYASYDIGMSTQYVKILLSIVTATEKIYNSGQFILFLSNIFLLTNITYFT